ncbi:hypothetical protein DITRI_Ditri06bG0141300 [Diplodiscus trichospermus]
MSLELASSDATLLLQVTAQEDDILHVAAKYDRKQMAEEIITMPQLASVIANQNNSKGDTPLHVAARLGSLRTADILVDCANSMSREIEAGERPVSIVNMEKSTALHDAARNGHFQISEFLIREHPELALLTNDVGEFPLFRHLQYHWRYCGIQTFSLCNASGDSEAHPSGGFHMDSFQAVVSEGGCVLWSSCLAGNEGQWFYCFVNGRSLASWLKAILCIVWVIVCLVFLEILLLYWEQWTADAMEDLVEIFVDLLLC